MIQIGLSIFAENFSEVGAEMGCSPWILLHYSPLFHMSPFLAQHANAIYASRVWRRFTSLVTNPNGHWFETVGYNDLAF